MSGSAPRGWHRPVRHRDVVLVLSGTALLWAGLVVGGAWSLRQHWQSVVTLRDQAVTLRLPEGMPARAEVHTPLFTRLDLQSEVVAPIDQVVSVQLLNKLNARAVINTSVPVETTVTFEQEIPVSTEVAMQIPVVSWLPAMNVVVPVTVKVPVAMTVPIKVQVPVVMDVAVTGQVDEAIKVPVRTTMHLSVPVHAKLRADVLNLAEFTLLGLQTPFELQIRQTEVHTPLREIGWCHGTTCLPAQPESGR